MTPSGLRLTSKVSQEQLQRGQLQDRGMRLPPSIPLPHGALYNQQIGGRFADRRPIPGLLLTHGATRIAQTCFDARFVQ